MAIEFRQGFTLHLQFHARVFLEDLRVTLAKQLCNPLVRHPAITQTSSVCRAEIVQPEVRNSRSLQREPPYGFQRALVALRVEFAREQIFSDTGNTQLVLKRHER